MTPTSRPKRGPKNISILDLIRYRLPWAGKTSILHRISGALLFLALPLLLIVFEQSLSLGASHVSGAGSVAETSFIVHPLFKAGALVLIWAFLHHFLAGIRYLLLDLHLGMDKLSAARSAKVATFGAAGLAVLVGARLFGLF